MKLRAALVALVATLSTLVAAPAGATSTGYWMIDAAGSVYAFGSGAAGCGNHLVVDPEEDTAMDIEPIPALPTGQRGYWTLDAFGFLEPHVCGGPSEPFYFGDAGEEPFADDEWAVSVSATPTGKGYWIFTSAGRVFAYGDARPFGDLSAVRLNGPVLDSVATPTGNGYWMVASDGGIFAFGDAGFFGSTGNLTLNEPVMSMAPTPTNRGYWLVASDGGIFAFGDARFFGSMGSVTLNQPVSGIVPGEAGYLMVAFDGGIFAFGDVAFHGSLGANPPDWPVTAVALVP
jgi:hypothetical protein